MARSYRLLLGLLRILWRREQLRFLPDFLPARISEELLADRHLLHWHAANHADVPLGLGRWSTV